MDLYVMSRSLVTLFPHKKLYSLMYLRSESHELSKLVPSGNCSDKIASTVPLDTEPGGVCRSEDTATFCDSTIFPPLVTNLTMTVPQSGESVVPDALSNCTSRTNAVLGCLYATRFNALTFCTANFVLGHQFVVSPKLLN